MTVKELRLEEEVLGIVDLDDDVKESPARDSLKGIESDDVISLSGPGPTPSPAPL